MAFHDGAVILRKYIDDSFIRSVIRSEEMNPSRQLGPRVTKDGVLVQVYDPYAVSIRLRTIPDIRYYDMTQVDDGYFMVMLPGTVIPQYTLQVSGENSQMWERYDAYAFPSRIEEKTDKRFNEGTCYDIYQYLGAHPMTWKGVPGTYFAVWAPNAKRVSVVGDFNHWDGRTFQMNRRNSGIFELFIPGVMAGDLYKYEVKTQSLLTYMKADPYANQAQLRPNTASIVCNLNRYSWNDHAWMCSREERQKKNKPISVYEIHLGSFRKPKDGRLFYNYRELAPMVSYYVNSMGYTHIELMPVMEYPLDESLGYETTGYYAPTSRYGSPDDFRYFVDYMHREGIGVILDWTPAQFPKDDFALAAFDGTRLYENPDPLQATHAHWGTYVYDFRKPEIRNFLIANALFWAQEYHADGIHLDTAALILYLDYRRKEGQWRPNIYGGNENLEGIEFLKHLNSIMHRKVPGILMISGETARWPGATQALEQEGLGFDYIWNTGWTTDVLDYMQKNPADRGSDHEQLSFSTVYGFSEKYILSLSHDNVIKDRNSLIVRMPGNMEDKYANMRLLLGYQLVHPGKKLLFMGQEFGEQRTWDSSRCLDWDLMVQPEPTALRKYISDAMLLYRKNPALYDADDTSDGFEWVNALESEKSLYVFLRKTSDQSRNLLVACNFSDQEYPEFRVGVPKPGRWKEVFNSDQTEYGGGGRTNPIIKTAEEIERDERRHSIVLSLAPLTMAVFECLDEAQMAKKQEKPEKEPVKKEKKAGLNPAELLQNAAQVKDDTLRRASEVADDTLRRASEVADDTLRRASEVADDTRRRASEVADDTIRRASEVADDTRRRASEVADGTIRKVKDTISRLTDNR